MKYVKQFIGVALALALQGTLMAQDDIGTETVTVIKSYSPTVADAHKINTIPELTDSLVLQKKKINYSIFSVPVASTFTPAKGRAAGVKKAKPEVLYNSYASVALGNFNNADIDLYTSKDIDRGEKRIDFALNHFSSRGDIDQTPLETDLYNTHFATTFSARDRDYEWNAQLAADHKIYHWYGVAEGVIDTALVADVDARQTYYNIQATASLGLEETAFQGGDLLLRRFWDKTGSGENRLRITPSLELPITDEVVNFTFHLDYLNGNFENESLNSLDNDTPIQYGYFQAGVTPSLRIIRDELTLNLGARIVVGLDTERNDTNFYLYPEVTASYRLADDLAIAYGGLQGQLRQNSYYDLVNKNPYVSPTLEIQPTDQQYDAYVGLRGQLSSNLSYNVKASYKAENRIPLFKLNPENQFRTDMQGYFYGNSFDVFYDDLRTFGLFGELSVDVNRNFSLGVNAEVFDYNTETNNPAWNLPDMKGALTLDYNSPTAWYFGASLFYVGEREDLVSQAAPNTLPQDFPSFTVALDSYFDANAYLGYRVNEQLAIFARGNNLSNNQYQRWANFRVQSLQILGGISYKFDF